MLEQTDDMQPRDPRRATRAVRGRVTGIAALAVLGCLLLPVVPFLVGGLLILAAALHAGSSTLRPFLEPVLRLPIAAPARRRAHLLLIAGAGLLLLVGGSVGAGLNGRVRGELEQRARMNEHSERRLAALLTRARHHIAAGDLEEAELVLLSARETFATDSARSAEVDELLDRVRRPGRPR